MPGGLPRGCKFGFGTVNWCRKDQHLAPHSPERDKTDGPAFVPEQAYQNDTAALPCYIDSIEIDDNSRWLPFEGGSMGAVVVD